MKMMKQNIRDEKLLKETLQTGTTTVGLIIKEGVVIGTDSQASAGFLVASKQAQ
jgi:20S proteasome alpha/beta subunit